MKMRENGNNLAFLTKFLPQMNSGRGFVYFAYVNFYRFVL